MRSVWHEDREALPSFEKLDRNEKTEVLIVGGGIAGLLTAYFLQQNGVKYLLVEKDRICSGVTQNTTAKITYAHGLIYEKLLKTKGFNIAQGYLMANKEACDKYYELCRDIDCDYEIKDNFTYSLSDVGKIEGEIASVGVLGGKADFCQRLPLPFDTVGAVRIKNQAQFNPIKFLSHIAKGLNVKENTRVVAIDGNRAYTDFGHIDAEKTVVATHFPIINKHGGFFIKNYQYRSYVLAFENAEDPNGMYLDEDAGGLSFRSYKNCLLLGGGGHRTGKTGGGYELLREFAAMHYPKAIEKYNWATQDCMTLDGMSYVGYYSKNTPDLYVASGFNKWGMSGSMLSAILLSDMLCGRKNQYEEVFDPSRSILKPQLLINGIETVSNFLRPTAPRCSHLGCALKWNKYEHSWDCPCHGSRFSENGNVIDTPAIKSLKKKH